MNSTAENGGRRTIGAHLLLLALVGLITLVPGSGSMPLMDRDEPRFSRATLEMMHSGDWIVPRVNGEYRFDKPILTYWLMSVGYRLFGMTELGARFHTIAAAMLTAFAIYGFGRRLFGDSAGLLAGFAWLTSYQIMAHGRLAVADMPMILCVTLAQWAIFELLDRGRGAGRSLWFWTAWLALGFGFLAKGPIALLVPALTLALHRWIGRAPLSWRRLRWWWGLPVVLAIAGAWGIPALLRTRGLFWSGGMERHVIERGVQSFNSRAFVPVLYYPATLFFSVFPWVAFLGATFARARPFRDPRASFLAAWFLAPMIIFSFYATQLPHYTMPGFPALLLLIGWALAEPAGEPRWGRILFTAVVSVHLLFAAAALALAVFWPFPALPELRWTAGGLALLGGGFSALAFLFRRGWGRQAALPVAALGLGMALVGFGLRSTSAAALISGGVTALPADAEVAAYRHHEPSIFFYGGLRERRWTLLSDSEALARWARERGPRAVLALERKARLGQLFRAATPEGIGRDFSAELDPLRDAGYIPGEARAAFNSGDATWIVLRWWRAPDGAASRRETEGRADQRSRPDTGDDIR